jgi:hypothetical protein
MLPRLLECSSGTAFKADLGSSGCGLIAIARVYFPQEKYPISNMSTCMKCNCVVLKVDMKIQSKCIRISDLL